MKELFLDHNAHTAMNDSAIMAYVNYNKSIAAKGHPMAPSKPGREAACELETARGKIANLLGAKKASQIIFTSTCTQACEWALQILEKIPTTNSDKSIYVSPVEHPAISYNIKNYNKLAIDTNGVVQTAKVSKAICIHVQNEIGIIQPLDRIEADYLMADMSQSVGKVAINLKDMPIDIAVFGGHKFGGSAGVGFMYLKKFDWWREFGSGSRYFSDRPGTPDVAAIVATAAALEEELTSMPERLKKMVEFRDILEKELENLGCEVIAKDAERVPNTTFIKLPNSNAMEVLLELSQQKIYVGLGSACGSMHTGDSKIMASLGRNGEVENFIRISQHGSYGKDDALYFIDKIKGLL